MAIITRVQSAQEWERLTGRPASELVISPRWLPQPKPYWVEAQIPVKGGRVIAYGVWHDNGGTRRECVKRFSVRRKGGWLVAACLANEMRDDLNAKEPR